MVIFILAIYTAAAAGYKAESLSLISDRSEG